MKNSKYILGLLVLVLVYASVGIAAAPSLTYTFKDVKAKGATETDTYAVNNAGIIAGDFVDSAGAQHAMILKGTTPKKIDDKTCGTGAGAAGISFYGINSAGNAVGWCTSTTSSEPIGLMYIKGKLSEFTVPKALSTEANGINDKGDVVGTFIDSNGAQHGFLLHAKKYTQIDAPSPDATSAAWSINNKGQIAVYAVNTAGGYDAFILTGKKFKKITDPNVGASGNVAHAINNLGDLDGTYYDSSGVTHGYLFHGGKYYSIDDPGGYTRADGLNDKLVIVGRYSSGTPVGFEAPPKK